MLLSEGEQFAILSLVDVEFTSDANADRLVAVPLAGGSPITLDDGTVGPDEYIITNNIYPPLIANDQVFYLRANNTGAAFYVVDVPTVSNQPGDFDNDGDVDGADFLQWQRDPGAGDLSAWQANYGVQSVLAVNSMAIPDPRATLLCALTTVWRMVFQATPLMLGKIVDSRGKLSCPTAGFLTQSHGLS